MPRLTPPARYACLSTGLLLGLLAQALKVPGGEPSPIPLILSVLACGLAAFAVKDSREPESPGSPPESSPPGPGARIAGGALVASGFALSGHVSLSFYRDWQGTPGVELLVGGVGLLLGALGADLLVVWNRTNRASVSLQGPGHLPVSIEASLLVLVVVIGADFRFGTFGVFPPPDGFPSVEEAQAATTGLGILRTDARPWEWPVALYTSAASFHLFGVRMESIRGAAAAMGLVSLVPFYFLVRRLTSPAAALFAALLLATSRWHVQTSWYMDNVFAPLPLFLLLMLVAFSCYRSPRPSKGVFLGLCSGVLLYAYPGFRVAAPLTTLFLAANVLRRSNQKRRHGSVLLAHVVAMLLVAFPLVGILRAIGPEGYVEALNRSFANREYYAADLDRLLRQQLERLMQAAGMFTNRADGFFESLNTRGEPLLDPFSSVAFVLGLGTTALLATRRHHAALVVAFAGLVYGSTTLVQNLDFRRLAILIPFTFLFTGFFAQRLVEAVPRLPALAGLSLMATFAALYNGHFLFRVLAKDPVVSDSHRDDYTLPLFYIHHNYQGEHVVLLTPADDFVARNLFEPNDYDFLKPASLEGQVVTDPNAVLRIVKSEPSNRAVLLLIQRPFDLEGLAIYLKARFPGATASLRQNRGDDVFDLLVCRIPARARREAKGLPAAFPPEMCALVSPLAPARASLLAASAPPGPEVGSPLLGSDRLAYFDVGSTRLSDGRLRERVVRFHPEDAWRFSVWASGGAPLVLRLVVSFQDGHLVVDDARTVELTGPFVLALDASPSRSRWRAGVYQARLFANETSVATLDFSVEP